MVHDERTGTWVTYADGKAASIEVRRSRLVIVGGAGAGQTVEVLTPLIRVGARPGCDLVLADSRVSGYHFEILLDDQGYRLRDLDSSNGTYVSGLRVRDVFLPPGAVISAGDTKIRFEPLATSAPVTLSEHTRFGDLVGESAGMRAMFARLERVAATETSVLITGETGTGKELVAQAIHDSSPRAQHPLVVVDCGSIPSNLISSELFGHEKGAFTGAFNSHAGAFEQASGGTIFLDEIGELPLDLQPALLGVLERKTVRRVGGKQTIPLDFRAVAATNRDLFQEMNRGRFREDLYYRLAVVEVQIPPLRDRLGDIPALVEAILKETPGAAGVRLKQQTIDNLMRHDYPGNVRELRNMIERALVLADTTAVGAPSAAALDDDDTDPDPSRDGFKVSIDVSVPFKTAKTAMVDQFERRYLASLIQAHGGNISAAARATGLDRMTVHKLLQRHRLHS